MNWGSVILLSLALAMDAAAVSAALGVALRRDFSWQKILCCALVFGGFQMVMPLIGWAGGAVIAGWTRRAGNIIAAFLLVLIGGKMFLEGGTPSAVRFAPRELLALGVATSLDALVVGVGLACLAGGTVVREALCIGIVTVLVVVLAGVLGRISGRALGRHCNYWGGGVLILIALKIVLGG